MNNGFLSLILENSLQNSSPSFLCIQFQYDLLGQGEHIVWIEVCVYAHTCGYTHSRNQKCSPFFHLLYIFTLTTFLLAISPAQKGNVELLQHRKRLSTLSLILTTLKGRCNYSDFKYAEDEVQRDY